MKYFLILLITTCYITDGYSQKNKTRTGPIFENFGAVYAVDDADLLLETNKKYKVIFDVYTDAKEPTKMNPLINTVARFMNMHGQNGVPVENMDIVVVLHGAATKNALSEKVFKKEFKLNHPNSDLLAALKENHVKLYICGQSMMSKGYERKDLTSDIDVSLSALTALVYFQEKGYQLINFN